MPCLLRMAHLQEGRTCRLPTEAEWEYACRAGTATQYSYGDDHNELSKYGSHKYFTDQTSEHKRLPNSFGLYDTHGSLWEWCSDYYDDYWYEKSFLPNDPTGPGKGSARVLRGGYYGSTAVECRSAYRFTLPQTYRTVYVGFRCVAELNVPTTAPTPPGTSSKLFMHDPAFPAWMAEVQAMTAEQQIEAVSKKLTELNPGFDGKIIGYYGSKPKIENGVVTWIEFRTEHVTDISPVRALSGLKILSCGQYQTRSKLSDLSPLQGLSLTSFDCNSTQVSDLSPLQGMPLTKLVIQSTKVSDLSPLKGNAVERIEVHFNSD